MTTNQAIQIQSGAVHHATLPEEDLEKRMYYLMHLWSTWGVPKDMRENAIKWKNRYKYNVLSEPVQFQDEPGYDEEYNERSE